MTRLSRILMATDFSNYSREALDYALYLAKKLGADLYLLHVMPPIYHPAMSSRIGPEVLKQIRSFEEEEHKKLVTLARNVSRKGMEVHPMFREGIPFREILKAADEISADLIVLGTQGRTGLDRFMIGSVAERVVRKSPCPVFVIRPKTRPIAKKIKAA